MLVAACLPYLLLSLFVDFVHLHPLLTGEVTHIAAAPHIGACASDKAPTRETPCAICQWLRTGVGLQSELTTQPIIVLLQDGLAPDTVSARGSPALQSFDPRGPPSTSLS
jgi:hypothetical protein